MSLAAEEAGKTQKTFQSVTPQVSLVAREISEYRVCMEVQTGLLSNRT